MRAVPPTLRHPLTLVQPAGSRAAPPAILLVVALGLILAGPSSAAERRYEPVRPPGKTAKFRLQGLAPSMVVSARLTAGRKWRRVSAAGVRRGAKRGVLRVKLSRSWRRIAARGSKRIVLRVRVRAAPVDPSAIPGLSGLPGPSSAKPPGDWSRCGSKRSWLGPSSPPACWRPYSRSSPFNQKIPTGARIAPNSARVVKRVLGFGPMEHLSAGDAGTTNDYGRPTYFNRPGDALFTVHCTERWGTCAVEGARVRIPDAARVPGGTDHHLSVVDQATGWEYDFWGVRSKPAGGGRLVVRWGGKTRIDGDGLGSGAVAAGYGTLAGTLRAEELQAGVINHALAMTVLCDSGGYVYPADAVSTPCSALGRSNKDAPALGMRFQLAMRPSQIDALDVPGYQKTLLRAMARYGMYVTDTGGTWGILKESALVTTSFGLEDRWVAIAKAVGAPYWKPDSRYAIHVREGVDWGRYLRVIDPCVARRSC